MQSKVIATVAAAFVFVATTTAEARRYGNQNERAQSEDDDDRPAVRRKRSSQDTTTHPSQQRFLERTSRRMSNYDGERGVLHKSVGDRPGAWCGWYMRTRHGGGSELNLAANWRRWGRSGTAQVGAIVVWPHHVGEIVGRAAGQWIVLSGNDGGQVRIRPRDISGAIVRI
jgi:hypothetical protein